MHPVKGIMKEIERTCAKMHRDRGYVKKEVRKTGKLLSRKGESMMERQKQTLEIFIEKHLRVGEREYLFVFPEEITEERLQRELDRLINEPAIVNIDADDVETLFGDKVKAFVGMAECRNEEELEQAAISALAMAKRGAEDKEPTKILIMITGDCSLVSVNDAVVAVQEVSGENPPETIFEYCFRENETGELPVEVMVLIC